MRINNTNASEKLDDLSLRFQNLTSSPCCQIRETATWDVCIKTHKENMHEKDDERLMSWLSWTCKLPIQHRAAEFQFPRLECVLNPDNSSAVSDPLYPGYLKKTHFNLFMIIVSDPYIDNTILYNEMGNVFQENFPV